MSRRQVRSRLSRIVSENFERAGINSGTNNDRYPVSHVQMRNLYHDIAFLGKVLMHLERKSSIIDGMEVNIADD